MSLASVFNISFKIVHDSLPALSGNSSIKGETTVKSDVLPSIEPLTYGNFSYVSLIDLCSRDDTQSLPKMQNLELIYRVSRAVLCETDHSLYKKGVYSLARLMGYSDSSELKAAFTREKIVHFVSSSRNINLIQIASVINDYDFVRCLINNGANPSLRNSDNFSAFTIALSKQYDHIVKILQEKGHRPIDYDYQIVRYNETPKSVDCTPIQMDLENDEAVAEALGLSVNNFGYTEFESRV